MACRPDFQRGGVRQGQTSIPHQHDEYHTDSSAVGTAAHHVKVGNGYSCSSGSQTESPACVEDKDLVSSWAVVRFDGGRKETWTWGAEWVNGKEAHSCRLDHSPLCGLILGGDPTQLNRQFTYTVDKHGKLVSAFLGIMPVLAK